MTIKFGKYNPVDRLKVHFIMLAAVILSLSSCKKNFSSTEFVEDNLVVLSEMVAGDSIKIPVGKTIKAGSGSIIRFNKVNDAEVIVREENGPSWMLRANYSSQYASNPATVYTRNRRLRNNRTYYLEIKHPVLGTVKAYTHIPSQPGVSIDTFYTTWQGKDVLAAEITLQSPADKNALYIIEAVKELLIVKHYFVYGGVRYDYDIPKGKALYEQVKNTPGVQLLKDTVSQDSYTRLNLYTDDHNTENSKINDLSNPFRRIFLPLDILPGQSYSTNIYIDREFFVAGDPLQKGKVKLQIKSVSKELYDYLLTYEKYKTDFGSVPSSDLISPDGNIQNGLGIFGGSAKHEAVYYFDKLQ